LLVEVKGPPVAVADLMQEIDARIRHGTDDDATLVLTDLRHRLDRYQQKLAPKAASPHLQEVRLVDPRDETNSLHEAHGAGRRVDPEALTASE
jgi:hypothetical protein